MSGYLVLGRILAPHGLRGALRVQSFGESPEILAQHRSWRVRRPGGDEAAMAVTQAQWDGHVLRVKLEGVDDREAAEALAGAEVLIARDALPPAGEHEFFRDDLVGFSVRNLEGVVFGTLSHFLEAPAGALMVVRGERERWLPTVPPHLKRVLFAQREIEVDWPADF